MKPVARPASAGTLFEVGLAGVPSVGSGLPADSPTRETASLDAHCGEVSFFAGHCRVVGTPAGSTGEHPARFDSGRRSMSLHATTTVEASADVSLRVPRGATEDLTSGVAGVLDAIDAVTDATVDRVTGVHPAYTDIRVDAAVTVRLRLSEDCDPEQAVRERLQDGFGITKVQRVGPVDPV